VLGRRLNRSAPAAARTSQECRSLGEGECFATIERILKAGSEKMHDTLLLPEYDYLGPISAADVEKID
jgi:hypothetical protein